jgi:hypothetical protein
VRIHPVEYTTNLRKARKKCKRNLQIGNKFRSSPFFVNMCIKNIKGSGFRVQGSKVQSLPAFGGIRIQCVRLFNRIVDLAQTWKPALRLPVPSTFQVEI